MLPGSPPRHAGAIGRRSALAGALVGLALVRCTLLTSTDGLAGPAEGADASSDAAPSDAGVPPKDAEPDADASAELPGLIGYWAFEEAGGNVAADSSGKGHDGLIAGSPQRVPGVRGRALSFSDNGSVEVDSLDGPDMPASGTLSFWLLHRYQGSTAELVFGQFDDTADKVRVQTSPGTTNLKVIFQVGMSDGSFASTFFTEPKMTPEKWQHVVVVWDTANDRGDVYVDGARYSDNWSTPGWQPLAQEFTLARRLVGTIDEVRLYDRPLGAAEVALVP